jgi:hypothetical protein
MMVAIDSVAIDSDDERGVITITRKGKSRLTFSLDSPAVVLDASDVKELIAVLMAWDNAVGLRMQIDFRRAMRAGEALAKDENQ